MVAESRMSGGTRVERSPCGTHFYRFSGAPRRGLRRGASAAAPPRGIKPKRVTSEKKTARIDTKILSSRTSRLAARRSSGDSSHLGHYMYTALPATTRATTELTRCHRGAFAQAILRQHKESR